MSLTGTQHPLIVGSVIPANGANAAARDVTQGAIEPQSANGANGAVDGCVTSLRNNFTSQVSVKSKEYGRSKESRVESREHHACCMEELSGLYDREEGEDGHDVEQSEFRWMQGFFIRSYTLTQALIWIKRLPAVQAKFQKLTPRELKVKEKGLMRKLIRARDSAAPFKEMIDEAGKIPLEALPMPAAYDEDTRRAAALFELASRRSRRKSFPAPMSAVALLLDCSKEEARRTIRDLINIPFIEQARKGKGSKAACYKLTSDDDEDVF